MDGPPRLNFLEPPQREGRGTPLPGARVNRKSEARTVLGGGGVGIGAFVTMGAIAPVGSVGKEERV